MGKKTILNQEQQLILSEFVSESRLSSTYYFTGGTALSEIYFQHRESHDLDFFTKDQTNPEILLEIVSSWAAKHQISVSPAFVDPTHIYFLKFPNGHNLKIDFARYPFPNLIPPSVLNGLQVDSLLDISANKLLMTNQRNEVKDFVDLYFIFQKLNFWELREAVLKKFRIDLDPYIVASDFMKVSDFEVLPMMHKELDLQTLKDFFHKQAQILGQSSVE